MWTCGLAHTEVVFSLTDRKASVERLETVLIFIPLSSIPSWQLSEQNFQKIYFAIYAVSRFRRGEVEKKEWKRDGERRKTANGARCKRRKQVCFNPRGSP